MRWSWKIGEFAGIGVYVHATFLLLIGWVALVHWTAEKSLAATIGGVAFVLALFLCVVLHEFGHALTARRYGIRTRDIVLLPIGGVARLERMPDRPIQEFWVALAGPAVNVVIAVALLLWLIVVGGFAPLRELGVATGPFLQRLMFLNVVLVVFNLIPAFPMDGGRVLRAVLAMNLEYTRATQIAAKIGQGLAFVFGFIGLFTNPFLVFIALFVWIGAAQEASMVQMKSALGGIPVQRVMQTDYRTLEPGDVLSRAVELTLAGSQKDFPVIEGERVVGVLTQADLVRGLERHGREATVSAAMQHDFEAADLSEMIEPVFQRLQRCQCHTIPVTLNGRLVGIVTMENVGEFVRFQSALAR
ncbi:MAG: site-2 protease family protein [Acidobacteriota bacterium]|nr:MAG: site-2 protease family protein [Acidobacteriota bacterium]